jgi:hypothetical protein
LVNACDKACLKIVAFSTSEDNIISNKLSNYIFVILKFNLNFAVLIDLWKIKLPTKLGKLHTTNLRQHEI